MKVYSQGLCVLITLFLVVACAPAVTQTQEVPTAAPQPTRGEKYHLLDTRTGVAEIDTVLDAVESGDPRSLPDLFSYTVTQCMTVNALGGPPPCREGEAEGTPVEVLPFLGSEGHYFYKDEINHWPGLEVKGIYAVYRVSENAYSSELYPKGDYGVLLVGDEENVALQVRDGGIIRIDYMFDLSHDMLTATLERNAAEMILAPIE